MKRKLFRIAACTLIIFFSMGSYSIRVEANTVTYKISVTIPAIIGFNVPPFENGEPDPVRIQTTSVVPAEPQPVIAEHLTAPYVNKPGFDLVEEEVMHFGERVYLRTIVLM